ncbi:MAG: beta-ketoacyl synthase [Thermoanaerobaculia bacterium]|nr:beta-ketoacyl synthase [Thermoanaerobaculia bacterium]
MPNDKTTTAPDERRVGIFGWGIVAPKSPNIDAFARNLQSTESWLQAFDGFGPDNFLVGMPSFDFTAYEPWVVQRFKPNRFSQLQSKMGLPVQYVIGCFIQALEQNQGLEEELRRLGTRSHIYVGTGLGDFGTQYEESLSLYRATRHWTRFWAQPDRNATRAAWDDGGRLLDASERHGAPALEPDNIPPSPHGASYEVRDEMEDAWWGFWAQHSPELRQYLTEQKEIESVKVEGNVESGKIAAMKEKRRKMRRLQEKWGAPEPPWQSVSANLVWNIDNIPAAQVSMLGQITGPTVALGAACSTFGVCLKEGLDAIRRGDCTAAVIGATDPPPHPLTVSAFYSARVISADGQLSKPLTELRGTHIGGGAAVWILGDLEHFQNLGMKPLGMEPLAVGVTSDADHIITPSKEGPMEAMRQAFEGAGLSASDMKSWDLHATATPGDFNEVEMVRDLMPEDVLVTARKGRFGHGMAAGGGWELTAQYLGYESGRLAPTLLSENELNEQIAGVHEHFVYDTPRDAPQGAVGKLSMGVGGINACVVSRPLKD